MPCRSDYLEPTPTEKYNQKVAKMFYWLIEQLAPSNSKKILEELEKDKNNIYCGIDYTEGLCRSLNNLSEKDRDKLFKQKSIPSLELELWEANHRKLDKQNQEIEKDRKNKKKLINSALDKLTKAEAKALGVEQKKNHG